MVPATRRGLIPAAAKWSRSLNRSRHQSRRIASTNQWIQLLKNQRDQEEGTGKTRLSEWAAGHMTMAPLLQRDPHGEVKS